MTRKGSVFLVILLVVVGLLLVGGVWYYASHRSVLPTAAPVPRSSPSGDVVSYKNDTYGFTLSMPIDWSGYEVHEIQWNGYVYEPNKGDVTTTTGPEIIIRNSQWTAADPYQDIPIMVLTPAQWSSYQAGNFAVSPAGVSGSELGSNNRYVFMLPPRAIGGISNASSSFEVSGILGNHGFQPFNL
jgi:hypothetical protein